MKGWFEFGYNGFPSGERRRRFFRQRDDPCGSEEENDDNDYDDETNDRPVFYYPLRRSEEGSSASSSSSRRGGGIPSGEDDDDDEEGYHGGGRGGAARAARLPLYAHTTAYEGEPAWYGATAVELTGWPARGHPHPHPHQQQLPRYLLWHGGAPAADPRVVSDGFTLAELARSAGAGHRHLPNSSTGSSSCSGSNTANTTGTTTATASAAAVAGPSYPQAVGYASVAAEASLEELLNAPLSHPALRACMTDEPSRYGGGGFATPRFGHCAVPVVLPTRLARALLLDGLPDATRDAAGRVVCPPVDSLLAASAPKREDYELHLSLVIGGSEEAPASVAATAGGSGFHRHQHHGSGTAPPAASLSPPSSSFPSLPSPEAATVGHHHHHHGNTPVMGHIRCPTMSRPALCLTLLRRAGGGGGRPAAHWTRGFELWGDSLLPLEPRMFATLTPWPEEGDEEEDDEECGSTSHDSGSRSPSPVPALPLSLAGAAPAAPAAPLTRRFAYFGGSETGLVPAPFFALTCLELDCRSWRWSARIVPTLGAEPPARFGHSTVRHGECLVVFGGVGRGRCFLNDLHVLDTRTLVWREVFAPLSVGLPPRAFHCATLLMGPQQKQQQRTGCGDDGDGNDHGRDAAQMLVVGGEGDDGAEASVWVCALDSTTAAWQPCRLPLLSQPQSYHVSSGGGGGGAEGVADTAARAGRLTASRLQQTINALAERSGHSHSHRNGNGNSPHYSHRRRQGHNQRRLSHSPSSSPQSLESLPPSPLPPSPLPPSHDSAASDSIACDAFFSAIHGSLAQAVALPPSLGGGALVLGGTRSPPVLLATHLQPPAVSLAELAAFWLLAAPHSLASRAMRGSPAYYWQLLGRSRFGGYVAAALEPPGRGSAHAAAANALAATTTTATAAMAETNRLVADGALDEQLSQWVRAAKRRLRANGFA